MLRNEAVTPAVDLWALGCLIFQMLAGKPPFKEASEYLTLEKVSAVDFAFPADFPNHARDLVGRLLDDQPSARLGMSMSVSIADPCALRCCMCVHHSPLHKKRFTKNRAAVID